MHSFILFTVVAHSPGSSVEPVPALRVQACILHLCCFPMTLAGSRNTKTRNTPHVSRYLHSQYSARVAVFLFMGTLSFAPLFCALSHSWCPHNQLRHALAVSVQIKTDDLDLAGSVVQDMASYLGVSLYPLLFFCSLLPTVFY